MPGMDPSAGGGTPSPAPSSTSPSGQLDPMAQMASQIQRMHQQSRMMQMMQQFGGGQFPGGGANQFLGASSGLPSVSDQVGQLQAAQAARPTPPPPTAAPPPVASPVQAGISPQEIATARNMLSQNRTLGNQLVSGRLPSHPANDSLLDLYQRMTPQQMAMLGLMGGGGGGFGGGAADHPGAGRDTPGHGTKGGGGRP